jgi:hypothetical protein
MKIQLLHKKLKYLQFLINQEFNEELIDKPETINIEDEADIETDYF